MEKPLLLIRYACLSIGCNDTGLEAKGQRSLQSKNVYGKSWEGVVKTVNDQHKKRHNVTLIYNYGTRETGGKKLCKKLFYSAPPSRKIPDRLRFERTTIDPQKMSLEPPVKKIVLRGVVVPGVVWYLFIHRGRRTYVPKMWQHTSKMLMEHFHIVVDFSMENKNYIWSVISVNWCTVTCTIHNRQLCYESLIIIL